MIKIDARAIGVAAARLRGLSEGKIQAATVSAINQGAFAGMKASQDEIRSVFDRPTPWIQKSPRYWKATKAKPEARIDLDFWGNKQGVSSEDVLRAEIKGGARKLKRFERALSAVGVLPPGMAVVPGEAAKMDAYGNMQAGQINQILSFFRAFGEQGYKANMNDKGRARLAKGTKKRHGIEYFVVTHGTFRTWSRGEGKPRGRKRMQPGIYERINFAMGSAIRPVMIFVKVPAYRPRLQFYPVAERAALEQIRKSLPEFLDQMLKERGL